MKKALCGIVGILLAILFCACDVLPGMSFEYDGSNFISESGEKQSA